MKQLDVQLRAGRVELTDINVNVSALAELLPQLSFRITSVRIGRVWVEISYTKLLTESLAFFVEDVVVEIEPRHDNNKERIADPDMEASTAGHQAERPSVARHQKTIHVSAHEVTGTSGPDDAERKSGDTQAGEGLDFLAQWIEQITSKVKVMMQNVKLRLRSGSCNHGGAANPFLEVRCSSLKWCDETPESTVPVTEGPLLAHNVIGGDAPITPVNSTNGVLFSQKVSSALMELLTRFLRTWQ